MRTDLVERIAVFCGIKEDVNECEYVEIFFGTGEVDEVINMVIDECIAATKKELIGTNELDHETDRTYDDALFKAIKSIEALKG